MATIHLLCGQPGSGKTTFARELEETHKAIRYTYDEWIVQLFGRSPSAGQFETLSNRVSNLIWRTATRNLALGTDVILDKGFWYQRDRENVRQAAAAIGAESKLYFLDAPIDVLRKRVLNRSKSDHDALWINNQAFTEFINRFEPPSDDEDFVPYPDRVETRPLPNTLSPYSSHSALCPTATRLGDALYPSTTFDNILNLEQRC